MSKLTSEALIEQLRVLMSQVDEATPITREQRAILKARTRRQPPHIVEASINVIGASDVVSQAIGQPIDAVRQLQVEAIGWDAAADELRSSLKAIESASVVRRERLAFIGAQAYAFGSQLAKDPANADLLPQVEEIKRLKGLARRKRGS